PGLEQRAAELVAGLAPDLVVLTGDYQFRGEPAASETGRLLAPILAAARPRLGAVAVLGNHDGHAMVEVLEGLGVRVLVNERLTLELDGARLAITGVDDVHKFHSPEAEAAIGDPGDGFRLALVHTPELAGLAAESGFDLYLCGHTHGGQICLPGGRAVFTLVDRHPELAAGPWRLGRMAGYTSRGVGVGFPPLRFNCPGEVALLTLRRTP
ncbi:MAG TPA: metallophosphoesterase, partial [Candidatus Omnitrophota bacterium]|nr:metallophosphoesterase [Candidatus Omnitrophota bacterium]